MSKLPVLAACLAGLLAVPGPLMAQPAAKPEQAEQCEACHGPGGNSQRPDVPRLNGQEYEYLSARLKEFLDPTRGTPHANKMMWENATKISDDTAAALARYFSRLLPTARSGGGSLEAAGAQIYLHGAEPDIPACATCHGQDGGGLGTTPRIAGQHSGYLLQQLQAFMLSARFGAPMNRHAWDMTPEQMRLLTDYLANN